MEVQLYVYDLTQGMARSMSKQFLGIQIDAVYHTALVFGGIEYFFGQGVQTCYPGSTHFGRPMEVIPLGTTHLPQDTIFEYLDSLKQVYSPESYDLFTHNCNNFTNDFAMFLVGRGIPEHITNLPKRVLDTPFGQMLRPQIDASIRSISQAPVPSQNVPLQQQGNNASSRNGPSSGIAYTNGNGMASGKSAARPTPYGQVLNVTSLGTLDEHLRTAAASRTAAIIFFTSSTCAPCKLVYPAFDSLAEQYPQVLFVKIDINSAREAASRYQVRATPTFMTFSKGSKQDEWSGADPTQLRINVERVINETFPPHPHALLGLPKLQYGSLKAVTYAKIPPLEKLMKKLGPASNDPAFQALHAFIEKREKDPREAALPDLHTIGKALRSQVPALPLEVRFAAIDLFRCSMIDPRVSGYSAEEPSPQTVEVLVQHVNELDACPHNLRLITIHLACNIFTSPLYVKELLKPGNELTVRLVQLVASSLLDNSHPATRTSAASLAFNLAAANYRIRREEDREALPEGQQVELAASLIETLTSEDNPDAARPMLLTLGYLLYFSAPDGELMDLCNALDAKDVVRAWRRMGLEDLAKEVESLL